MLSQTVMQIMADPPLLGFRDFQKFLLQTAALPDFLPQAFRPLIHQILQMVPGGKQNDHQEKNRQAMLVFQIGIRKSE